MIRKSLSDRSYLVIVLSFALTSNAVGQIDLPFIDNFNDGDATDGMPGTWIPGDEPGGIRDASSGDLVVTHSDQSATALEESSQLLDVSLRTQLTFSEVSGNTDSVALWARSTGRVYFGGITTDGVLGIGLNDGAFFDTIPSSLDPVGGDVLLQFDVIGNEISLTAWQEGTPKPARPQLSRTNNTLTQPGRVGFTLTPNFGGGSGSATVVLRHYMVVPEPSTTALLCVGFISLLVRPRAV